MRVIGGEQNRLGKGDDWRGCIVYRGFEESASEQTNIEL